MMDLRKRLLIIISLIIGLVIVFLLLFFVFNKKDNQVVPTGNETTVIPATNGQNGQGNGQNTNTNVQTQPIIPQDPDEVYTKQLSRIFVERFSSYSNQNDNSHIEDVLSIVTDKMANWLKTQALEQKSVYEGMTTKVIASSVEKIDDTTASILVETQQVVETDSTEKLLQRSGRVSLVKIDNTWKVDGFFWE